MKRTLKKYFIPHRENNYHPHILHTKRVVFYSLVFALFKAIIVGFVLLIPNQVFVSPDILAIEERRLIDLTNEYRAEENYEKLVISEKLMFSAHNKAGDMSAQGYFSHDGPQKDLSVWLNDAGYKFSVAGENLAVGFIDSDTLFNAWIESPTHRANILDKDFKEMGVGLSGGERDGQPVVYVAQHFGSPFISGSNQVVNGSTIAVSQKFSSPAQKYFLSKRVLPSFTSIFGVSSAIYLFGIIFFAAALMLSIFIEFRRQHAHVIIQTAGLIGLLFCFWMF